jgi:phosphoribosyl 1,2-cyclic phosphodiesterase
MNGRFEVAFLGTNGSCAYNNGSRAKYGTNTLCVAVKAGDETLLFDAGTGICGFHELPDYHTDRLRLFFSHYHMDHVAGLLFFPELFDPAKKIDIYGSGDVHAAIDGIISPPMCPVGLSAFQAALSFHPVAAGKTVELSGGVTVRAHGLSHPGGALGYRVEYGGKVFCYCDDVELANHRGDSGLLDFIRGADLLVLDSAFADGKVIPGWGHSSPGECAEWAVRAEVKRLAIYHYNFLMSDAEIDAMEEAAQKIFPNTFAVPDGMRTDV